MINYFNPLALLPSEFALNNEERLFNRKTQVPFGERGFSQRDAFGKEELKITSIKESLLEKKEFRSKRNKRVIRIKLKSPLEKGDIDCTTKHGLQ